MHHLVDFGPRIAQRAAVADPPKPDPTFLATGSGDCSELVTGRQPQRSVPRHQPPSLLTLVDGMTRELPAKPPSPAGAVN